MKQAYNALVVDYINEVFTVQINQLHTQPLKQGEVRIKVFYSSLNYKDCLACHEQGKITKKFPHVPGIDLSGEIIESNDARFEVGDKVIATSYGIGVSHYGGFSEIATVQGDWIVPLPANLSMREAMIIGTAGLTAALSILRLEQNGLNRAGESVLVTGATGGVGSLSIAMLNKLGYNVVACTRKDAQASWLKEIGASQIQLHEQLVGKKIKSLDEQRWEGAIDAVGGQTLAAIISQLKYGASVAVSGLTGGTTVETSVFPFILRGVNILGIDSVYYPMEQRIQLWHKIADEMKPDCLEQIVREEVTLQDIKAVVSQLLKGNAIGRYIVKLSS